MNNSDEDDWDDVLGHGTKVASYAESQKYGSAKKPWLRMCKLGSRFGKRNIYRSLAAILRNNDARKQRARYKGAVLNMSFKTEDTPGNSILLKALWNHGVSLVAAAANAARTHITHSLATIHRSSVLALLTRTTGKRPSPTSARI